MHALGRASQGTASGEYVTPLRIEHGLLLEFDLEAHVLLVLAGYEKALLVGFLLVFCGSYKRFMENENEAV